MLSRPNQKGTSKVISTWLAIVELLLKSSKVTNYLIFVHNARVYCAFQSISITFHTIHTYNLQRFTHDLEACAQGLRHDSNACADLQTINIQKQSYYYQHFIQLGRTIYEVTIFQIKNGIYEI